MILYKWYYNTNPVDRAEVFWTLNFSKELNPRLFSSNLDMTTAAGRFNFFSSSQPFLTQSHFLFLALRYVSMETAVEGSH